MENIKHQLSDGMVKGLYEDAETNGLTAKEYLSLVKRVDDVINFACQNSKYMKTNEHPKPYDINGKLEEV